jgi:FAD/FMN-containing dehydrogenase/Fe-S oxidoreductase
MSATLEPVGMRDFDRPLSAARDDLAAALDRAIEGEVRFDRGSRALYATDSSNYRRVPIGVVVPRHTQDVVETLRICRAHGAPIVHRGGGTSLAGQTCNVAVVIDFSKYVNRILALDFDGSSARVEPGLVLDELRTRAETRHLTFGPDPSTHNRCTLGGMIGNNSCGVHSVMAGTTADNVHSLDVLTYGGARFEAQALDGPLPSGDAAELVLRARAFRDKYAAAIRAGFPDIPRRVSGYDLPALLPEKGASLARALVGSEGTLVTVLEASVRLVHSPPARTLVVLGYPSVFEAADAVPRVMESGPIGLEGIDDVLVEDMKTKGIHPEGLPLLPPGRGWLVVEMGGETREEADGKARELVALMKGAKAKIYDDPEEEHIVWTVRESGLGATARIPGQPDTWEGWEDSAVPPERLGAYLRELKQLFDDFGYRAALYGHFGQGCVHTRIPFDLRTEPGVRQFRAFVERAADLVVSLGGSLSGEHGDGQSRADLLPKMFSPELMHAFEEWKAIWDPDDRMNPGRIVRAGHLDEDLRLGPDYQPPAVETHFRFAEDQGSFAHATERCVGVGECRKHDGGTMCPSYMVTREEEHSTRGRAHLLFEMMRGGIEDGWRSEAIADALDLCLSCKACKHECPLQVDMATWKSEFLSHHYEGRIRPRSAYAFGLLPWTAPILSWFAPVVRVLATWAPTAAVLKAIAGIHRERRIPVPAPVTFRTWWRTHPRATAGRRVLLWVDTFHDHWEPDVLVATVGVLEDAGFLVELPETGLCCGRPLYDYGMLDLAKSRLRQILESLRPAIRAGIPVVGVEPSCVSVLRDELVSLFPDDPDAKALAGQTHLLDELLDENKGWVPPRLDRKALVHGHCHQKSVLSEHAGEHVLTRAGLEVELADAGCCGMAGGFGYERAHFDVSIACGERKLLPMVRDMADDTIVVADGFSCREQIRERTGREALHLAQVLRLAKESGPQGPSAPYPERSAIHPVRGPIDRRGTVLIAAGVIVLGLALWRRR